MTKVYIASKLKYAPMFRSIRDSWKPEGIELHARWFDQVQHEETATPDDFKIFWRVDEHDVKTSRAVIVYAQEGDELRGALIEAGIAIGNRILVILVGECASYGTWQHHPCVVRATGLDHAFEMILRLYGNGARK